MAIQARSQLGFSEAVKLAARRLLDFKGRSRRSEFWWWMLLLIIAKEVIQMFIPGLYLNAIVSTVIMFCGLGATVRRVQDSGKSAIWVYVSFLLDIFTQFYAASSTFVQKFYDMASSGVMNSEKVARMAEKSMGELAVMGTAGTIYAIVAIVVIVFCLMDGKPGPNKYGESPKYFEA